MITPKKLLLLFLAGMATATSLGASESLDARFRKALVTETAERDVEGALGLYDHLLEADGLPPLLKSKVRYRRALCLERLGRDQEALIAYEKAAEGGGADAAEARSSVDRLRDRFLAEARSRELSRLTLPKSDPRKKDGWEAALEFGRSHRGEFRAYGTNEKVFGYGPRHAVVWLSLDRRFSPGWSVGLDGASFLENFVFETGMGVQETVTSALHRGGSWVTKTEHITSQSFYAGPRLRRSFYETWGALTLGVGAGLAHRRVNTRSFIDAPFSLPGTIYSKSLETRTTPALLLTVGLELKLGRRAALLASIKDVVHRSRQNFFPEIAGDGSSFVHHGRPRLYHVWTPTIGIKTVF